MTRDEARLKAATILVRHGAVADALLAAIADALLTAHDAGLERAAAECDRVYQASKSCDSDSARTNAWRSGVLDIATYLRLVRSDPGRFGPRQHQPPPPDDPRKTVNPIPDRRA